MYIIKHFSTLRIFNLLHAYFCCWNCSSWMVSTCYTLVLKTVLVYMLATKTEKHQQKLVQNVQHTVLILTSKIAWLVSRLKPV